MRNSGEGKWQRAAALAAAAVLVAGALRAQDDVGLTSFLPQADRITIQKTSTAPDGGNVIVTVSVAPDQVDSLIQATGRGDFFVVGPPGGESILRDDGQGGDPVAGDGQFTGFALVDDQDLIDRANDDQTAVDSGVTSEPVFGDSRNITGTRAIRAFDINGFLAGRAVDLDTPVVAASDPSTAEPAQPVSKLLASSHAGLVNTSAAAVVPGTNPFQDHVLMIVDPSVVQDPTRTFDACTNTGTPLGPWTFGRLMTEIANQPASGIDPRDLVEQWLTHWLTNQTLNGFTAPARINMKQIISDWRTASGGGKLNLAIAPFRLLAIVPRMDLRDTVGGGGGYLGGAGNKFLNAGEARFVFGFLLPPGYQHLPSEIPSGSNGCRVLPFSVIFEYGVPKCECEDVVMWAMRWSALSTLPFPSATYNAALQRLTDEFTLRGANPTKPNGSALNQLRTNEIALAGPWELRQFDLTTPPFSFFHENFTNDTPDDVFNNTATFSNFVLGGVRHVPLLFGGNPFLTLDPHSFFVWNGPLPLDAANNMAHADLRFGVAINTCNGCHLAEPQTPFVHVDPSTQPLGAPANLSGFLTGITVPDPIFSNPFPKLRDFDDLARRELDIKKLARTKCALFQPIDIRAVRSALLADGTLPPILFPPKPFPLRKKLGLALSQFRRIPVRQVH